MVICYCQPLVGKCCWIWISNHNLKKGNTIVPRVKKRLILQIPEILADGHQGTNYQSINNW